MNKLKPSFYLSRLCMMFMAFKCKECGLKFEEKRRLDIHKQVHGRKSKISEYGSPEFNQDRLRGWCFSPWIVVISVVEPDNCY